MKHGATEGTETHGGPWRGLNGYREAAVKARAQEISGETIAAAVEVHRQLGPGFNTELLMRGLRRVLNG